MNEIIQASTHTEISTCKVTDKDFLSKGSIKISFRCKCENSAFWAYVDYLLGKIEAIDIRKRKRARRSKQALRQTLADVLMAIQKAEKYYIGVVRIDLNKNSYHQSPKRYRKGKPSYSVIKTTYEGLKKLGLITIVRQGNFSRGEAFDSLSTRFRSTETLRNELAELSLEVANIKHEGLLETVILREKIISGRRKMKVDIDYTDTTTTRIMRNQIERINKAIAENHVDLELTNQEFEIMQQALCHEGRSYEVVDLHQKYLYRVFNSDFRHGGRFYGPWWQQIGSEWRRYIKINGNRTVEIDYSQLHPTLLYALAKLPMPDTPYEIGIGKREDIKVIFNALINASEGQSIKPLEHYDYHECQKLIKATQEFHEPVSKFFCKGYGLKFQYIDAQMAAYILTKFAEEGIVCLVIHDSFIVQESHFERLKQLMQEAAVKYAKMDIPIKIKEGHPNRQSMDEIINFTEDDEEGKVNSYSRYNQMFVRWIEGHQSPPIKEGLHMQ